MASPAYHDFFCRLFTDDGGDMKSKDEQIKSFELIHRQVKDLTNHLPTIENPDEKQDEIRCVTSTLLYLYKTLMLKSTVVRCRCVHDFIMLIYNNKQTFVKVEDLKQILNEVTEECGISQSTLYSSALSYSAQEWITQKLEFKHFPYQLFNCSDLKSFYSKYAGKFLPLIPTNDSQMIKSFMTLTGSSDLELIQLTIPELILHTIPVLETGKNDQSTVQAKQRFDWMQNTLVENGQELADILQTKLTNITLSLLNSMYDQHEKFSSEAEPPLPHYTTSLIKSSLIKLYKLLSKTGVIGDSIIDLISAKLSNVMRLLYNLTHTVVTSWFESTSRHYVDSFSVFIELLCEHLYKSSVQSIIHNVVQLVTHTAVITLSKNIDADKMSVRIYNYKIMKLLNSWSLIFKTVQKGHIRRVLLEPSRLMTHVLVSLSTNKHLSADVRTLVNSILDMIWCDNLHLLKLDTIEDVFSDKFSTMYPDLELCTMSVDELYNSVTENGICSTKQKLHKIKDQLDNMSKTELLEITVDPSAALCRFVDHIRHDKTSDCEVRELYQIILCRLGAVTVRKCCDKTQNTKQLSDVEFLLVNDELITDEDTEVKRDLLIISLIINILKTDSEMGILIVCDEVLSRFFQTKACKDLISFLDRYDDIAEIQGIARSIKPYITKSVLKLRVGKSMDDLIMSSCWSVKQYQSDKRDQSVIYCDWITGVIQNLCKSAESDILRIIEPLARVKLSFSERIFPYLITDVLSTENNSLQSRLSTIFTNTLDDCLNKIPGAEMSEKVLRLILDTVQYLRTQPNTYYNIPSSSRVRTSWSNNLWLNISYKNLSSAAYSVRDYHLAIMYAEIDMNIKQERTQSDLQEFMLLNHKLLGDTDSCVGWGLEKLKGPNFRMIQYEQNFSWSRALATKDYLQIKSNHQHIDSEYMRLLEMNGLTGLYSTSLQHLTENTELRYKQAWSNTDWSTLPTTYRMTDKIGYNECVYSALHSLDTQSTTHITHYIKHLSELCTTQLREDMVSTVYMLQSSQILQDISNIQISPTELPSLLVNWKRCDDVYMSQLISADDVMSSHNDLIIKTVLMKICNDEDLISDYIKEQFINLSKTSRKIGFPQFSERLMNRLEDNHSSIWSIECDLEQSKIFYQFGDLERALHIIQQCIENTSDAERNRSVLSSAYRLAGQWLAEQKTISTHDIYTQYLSKSVELAEQSQTAQEIQSAHYALACFSDSEYERIKSYRKSQEYQQKLDLYRQHEAVTGSNLKTDKEMRKLIKNLVVDHAQFESEINDTEKSFIDNLTRSLKSYLHCVLYGDEYDLMSVFRAVSIWLENDSRDEVLAIIQKLVPGDIMTYKFLPLMVQLAARLNPLTSQKSPHQTALTKLVSKSAVQHPHHTLPVLLALKAAVSDQPVGHSVDNDTKMRAVAAEHILENISRFDATLVNQYETVCKQLIKLANVDAKNAGQAKVKQAVAELHKLENQLNKVAVLTHNLPIQKDGEYDDFIHIVSYLNRWSSAGGINVPKIIYCIGSDGKQYKQLCKGRDDMRQDAMMEQIFTLINKLMKPDTQCSDLYMRTYKIIPLSQQSGLIEWCNGTLPIGEWLKNDGKSAELGAHLRYHPNCIPTLRSAHSKMVNASKTPTDDRITVFEDICSHIKPVMRYFFFEKFNEPVMWYKNRLNYTRSVAVSSIVGYILGIGDRHTNNILIDLQTADVVHIDFGYSFDVGLSLPVPETVPFRLTRDMVDGMGPTEVEGVFRRSCERTLKVMSENRKIIYTILQVLVDDPLLDWVISDAKLNKIQPNSSKRGDHGSPSLMSSSNTVINSNSGSKLSVDQKHQRAETALLKINNRLSGRVGNCQLSISGHVNYLIQQAQDVTNLSCIYAGWTPFL